MGIVCPYISYNCYNYDCKIPQFVSAKSDIQLFLVSFHGNSVFCHLYFGLVVSYLDK